MDGTTHQPADVLRQSPYVPGWPSSDQYDMVNVIHHRWHSHDTDVSAVLFSQHGNQLTGVKYSTLTPYVNNVNIQLLNLSLYTQPAELLSDAWEEKIVIHAKTFEKLQSLRSLLHRPGYLYAGRVKS